jgi:hypothetical protein
VLKRHRAALRSTVHRPGGRSFNVVSNASSLRRTPHDKVEDRGKGVVRCVLRPPLYLR